MRGARALTAHWERPVLPAAPSPRRYVAGSGRKRALPDRARLRIYQLLLTIDESEKAVKSILAAHGIVEKESARYHKLMIRRRRG